MKPVVDQVLNQDCLEAMKEMPDESIDLIATDPPYGIAFMGKSWDKAVPPVDVWRECLRVLKPGGWAFIMCIPRMDCQAQMVMNLKEAGFDVSFSPIYHTFAQGFDKAMNMSKKVDQRLGMEREKLGQNPHQIGRKTKNIGQYGGYTDEIETIGQRESYISAPASPEAIALDGAYSSFQPKPAVEVVLVCQKPFAIKHKRSDVYRILGGRYGYWYTARTEVKEPKGENKGNIDKLTKQWKAELEGIGYSLKDGDVIERRLALREGLHDEVIVNRSTILRSSPYNDSDITSSITHALENGRGVTWLDDARIPYESEDDKKMAIPGGRITTQVGAFAGRSLGTGIDKELDREEWQSQMKGRFPANILVSDDVLNSGEITTSKGAYPARRNVSHFGGEANTEGDRVEINDTGGFSRFFSLDAWAEKHLPESVLKTFPFLLVPKASKSEKNAGLDELPDKQMYKCDSSGNSLEIFGTTDGGRLPRKNAHPTVKPVKLMAFLITMGSRPGDVIFDPYLGSGTTAVAAVTLKRHFIGCDTDPESCEIAELRVKYAQEQVKTDEPLQLEFNLGG